MKVFGRKLLAIVWVTENYNSKEVSKELDTLDLNGIVKMPDGRIVVVDELGLLNEPIQKLQINATTKDKKELSILFNQTAENTNVNVYIGKEELDDVRFYINDEE